MQGKYEENAVRKMQHIVDYAYRNFPLYAERMSKKGIDLRHIQKLDDLKKLPFVSKAELQKVQFEDILKCASDKLYYIGFTSGSTAAPMPLYCTSRDFEIWVKNTATGLLMGGVTKEDTVQLTFGQWGLGMYLFLEALRTLGASAIPVNIDVLALPELLDYMGRFRVSAIVCFPSIALELCRALEEKQSAENLRLRRVFLLGESCSESGRERIGKSLAAEVYNIYGSMEVGMIASECKRHEGLHILANQVIVEIVDPDTGEVVAPGNAGEVVVTTLWKEALPLIRYRTGDIASMIDGECSCGLKWPRISEIVGRLSDFICIGSTKIHPVAIEDSILSTSYRIHNFQIVISREGERDKMTLILESSEPVGKAEELKEDLLEKICNLNEDLGSLVKANIVAKPEVRFVKPGSLRMSSGKIKKLLDLRAG